MPQTARGRHRTGVQGWGQSGTRPGEVTLGQRPRGRRQRALGCGERSFQGTEGHGQRPQVCWGQVLSQRALGEGREFQEKCTWRGSPEVAFPGQGSHLKGPRSFFALQGYEPQLTLPVSPAPAEDTTPWAFSSHADSGVQGLLPGDTDSRGARVFLAQRREVGTGSALHSPP